AGVSLTVAPAAPSAYRITAASATPTAGASDALTIKLVDQYQNVVTSFNGDKNLTFSGLANAPGGTVPTVTSKTGSPVNFGTATTITFASGQSSAGGSLVAYKAEGPVTLAATDGTLSTSTAGGAGVSLTVSVAAASQLAFAQQPNNATAGVAIAPAITVHVTDSFSNNVSGVAVVMTLSSGSGALSGTASRTSDPAGLATFNDLSINLSGSKNLTASSTGPSPVVSSPFTISPAAASQLAFVQPPSNATAGVVISPTVTVHVADSFSNNVPGVSVAMAINSGTGILSGTTSHTTDAAGIASFDNLTIDLSGAKTLIATSGVLTPATSGSFTISPAAASQLAFAQQPTNATAGAAIAPAVTAQLK